MRLIERAVKDLRRSRLTAVLTGAGISVESGIPPFRGKGGVWEKIDPVKYAHIDSFLSDPEDVWRVLIKEMKEVLDIAKPNNGHLGLSKLEDKGIVKTIITQNVDGLHQVAGSKDVIEFHGNFAWQKCIQCGSMYESKNIDTSVLPPRCIECNGILRPDCIFFGEEIPFDALERSRQVASQCDVMLVIGTSAEVQPAAYMPVIAKRNNAVIIEINPEPTYLTNNVSDYIIKGGAGSVLSEILRFLE